MSSLLDFAQTLAIIDLQKKQCETKKEFDPLTLYTKEFLLYTLSLYDIRNPGKSISLIKKAKEACFHGFSSSALEKFNNDGLCYDILMVNPNIETFKFHKIQRDKVLDEIIAFYESLALKAHFVLSSYHVETIESFVDKLLELERIYEYTASQEKNCIKVREHIYGPPRRQTSSINTKPKYSKFDVVNTIWLVILLSFIAIILLSVKIIIESVL